MKSRKRSKKISRKHSTRWSRVSPKTKSVRISLRKRCGSKAFLIPSKLKFPVMRSRGPCRYDCKGIMAAYKRSRQYRYPNVSRKALNMLKNCKRSRYN